jgi:hypothetical protein
MVPPAWFPDAAARARRSPDVDLGVHLTLTSESSAFRWSALCTDDPASGLLDPDGYLWPTVPEVRAHATPEAVEAELVAQIQRAIDHGIDVTHLDHHMGCAIAPEFVDVTESIARRFELPVLFPADIDGYLAVLKMGDVDPQPLLDARARLARDGFAVGDRFLMGLTYMDEPDAGVTMRRLFDDLEPGTTYLSLHCTAPGEIDAVHPKDAHWRTAEFDLYRDPEFATWVRGRDIELAGMRAYRDRLRGLR